jgi:hypothetical protein
MKFLDLVNPWKQSRKKLCNTISFVIVTTGRASDYNAIESKKKQLDFILSDHRCRLYFHELTSTVNMSDVMNLYLQRESFDVSSDTIVYLRDDIYINDANLVDKLLYATNHSAIVGVAGSKSMKWYQPGWQFSKVDDRYFTLDDKANLLGRLLHTTGTPLMQGIDSSVFGQCHVIDDTLIAVNRNAVIASDTLFDSNMDFNFSAIDFCLTASRKGLKIECIPVDIYYDTSFDYCSLEWYSSYVKFQNKWRDLSNAS